MKKNALFGILMSLMISITIAVSAFAIIELTHKHRIVKPGSGLKDWGDIIDHKFNRGGILRPNVNELIQGAYKNKPVRWITNSQGFRNDHEFTLKPKPGTLRIMYIGDSFVLGYRLSQEHLSGLIMEQVIRSKMPIGEYKDVEVMICGAMDPFEARNYFNLYGAQYQPQIVILGICLGNDIAAAGFRQYRFKETGNKNRPDVQESMEKEFEKTFAKVPLPKDVYNGGDIPTTIYAFNDTFLQPGIYYQPTLPETDLLFKNFEEVLSNFKNDVEARKITFCAVIFPLREQVYHAVWKRQCAYFNLNMDKFDLDYSTKRLSVFFSAQNMHFLVLLPYFLYVLQQPQPLLYFPEDNMHWSAEGNILAGKIIGAYVISQLLEKK